jgi:hypothetical protein
MKVSVQKSKISEAAARQLVLDTVKELGTATARDIREKTGLSFPTIYKHCRRMTRAGVLDLEHDEEQMCSGPKPKVWSRAG